MKLLARRPQLIVACYVAECFSKRKLTMKIPVLVVLLVAAMLAGLALIFFVL
jgi:hypothetical protein